MSQEEGDRPRKRFNVLARKAEAFFEEAGGESWNARRIADQNWALLSVEQKASADGIRRELRKTLSLLVPEIQDAPLLDIRRLRCWTNEIWSGLQGSVVRWMLLSDLSRFAATTSATSLPRCFERHTRKLGNCLTFCREKAVATASCRQRSVLEVAQVNPGGHQATEPVKVRLVK